MIWVCEEIAPKSLANRSGQSLPHLSPIAPSTFLRGVRSQIARQSFPTLILTRKSLPKHKSSPMAPHAPPCHSPLPPMLPMLPIPPPSPMPSTPPPFMPLIHPHAVPHGPHAPLPILPFFQYSNHPFFLSFLSSNLLILRTSDPQRGRSTSPFIPLLGPGPERLYFGLGVSCERPFFGPDLGQFLFTVWAAFGLQRSLSGSHCWAHLFVPKPQTKRYQKTTPNRTPQKLGKLEPKTPEGAQTELFRASFELPFWDLFVTHSATRRFY